MFRVTNTETRISVVGHISADTDQQGDASHQSHLSMGSRNYQRLQRRQTSQQQTGEESVSQCIVDSYRAQISVSSERAGQVMVIM